MIDKSLQWSRFQFLAMIDYDCRFCTLHQVRVLICSDDPFLRFGRVNFFRILVVAVHNMNYALDYICPSLRAEVEKKIKRKENRSWKVK